MPFLFQNTTNDKSFEGEKFCGLLGSVTEILFRWKFWSGTNFFRKKRSARNDFFWKKWTGPENFVPVYVFIKNGQYDVKESAKKQIGSKHFS